MVMMMTICQKLKTTHGSSHIGYNSWNLTPKSVSSLSMFIKITSTATSQNFEKPPEVFTWGELQDLCKWVVPSPNRNLWKFLFLTSHSPLYNIRKIKTRQGRKAPWAPVGWSTVAGMARREEGSSWWRKKKKDALLEKHRLSLGRKIIRMKHGCFGW